MEHSPEINFELSANGTALNKACTRAKSTPPPSGKRQISEIKTSPYLYTYTSRHAKATTPVYDSRDVPISEKQGITMGMSMTEKQGGSDVRTNTTFAIPLHNSIVCSDPLSNLKT